MTAYQAKEITKLRLIKNVILNTNFELFRKLYILSSVKLGLIPTKKFFFVSDGMHVLQKNQKVLF